MLEKIKTKDVRGGDFTVQIGPPNILYDAILPRMIRAIAGIKNQIKWIITALYSLLGSALTKILTKNVGHMDFRGLI